MVVIARLRGIESIQGIADPVQNGFIDNVLNGDCKRLIRHSEFLQGRDNRPYLKPLKQARSWVTKVFWFFFSKKNRFLALS
jgi:hypothetical protein